MSDGATRWIEVITVRAPGGDLDELARRIRESFAGSADGGGPVRIRILRSAALETDLSVHVHLCGGADGLPPSDETGLRLARALEDHGLVDRSVWIEVEPPRERSLT